MTMNLLITRIMRTPSSEQLLLHRNQKDIAALDVHYAQNGKVHATLILFEETDVKQDDVPALLTEIDEKLFPEASIGDHNLSFTVVVGRVLGAYAPDQTNQKGQ
jgi:hypothetical protein